MLMRAVSNAGLLVLMRLDGGEAELSRDPVCPSQELPIRELVAARWGDKIQWSIHKHPPPHTHTHTVLTESDPRPYSVVQVIPL